MSFPMKAIRRDNGNSSPYYREMTEDEYKKELLFCQLMIDPYLNSSSQANHEYGLYLQKWFSAEECDGLANFKVRYAMHKLPLDESSFFSR